MSPWCISMTLIILLMRSVVREEMQVSCDVAFKDQDDEKLCDVYFVIASLFAICYILLRLPPYRNLVLLSVQSSPMAVPCTLSLSLLVKQPIKISRVVLRTIRVYEDWLLDTRCEGLNDMVYSDIL